MEGTGSEPVQGQPPAPPTPPSPPTTAAGPTGPTEPSRRSILTGAAVAAAVVGAGAGAGAAALLRPDAEKGTPYLAAGSTAGGDKGPWHYVEPGGSIQDSIDAGAKAIQLGAGTYEVSAPIVPTAGCTIRGIGRDTRLLATAAIPAVLAIGNGGPIDAVTISDLTVDAQGKAQVGIDLDIVGTTGNYRDEPDSVCRLDALWVYQPVLDGIAYRGKDTQACVTSRVRVRGAGRHGYRVEAPDNVWIACEATTSGTSGAGFYVGTAVQGSDGIGAANCHFHACKAWYCRGVGWQVKSTRNAFMGCESQDTAGHGWSIEIGRNAFTGCIADTAGMYDVGGRPGTADGFFVVPGAETTLVGCLAFDRTPGGHAAQQRYGFNVPRSLVQAGLVVAHTGWGNTAGLINQR